MPISTKLGTTQPWVKGIQFCSNEGPCPFSRGDYFKIAKIHWQNLKIFFSWTTKPISTKLCTRHPWMKGIQFCSNDGPCPFPTGGTCNYDIAKIDWQILKIFFSRATEPISTSSIYFRYFVINTVWQREGTFNRTKLNSLYLRMICAKFGWNWLSGSWEFCQCIFAILQ